MPSLSADKPILLSIDNPYFERIVSQIYPPALQLTKANTSDIDAPFSLYIYLFLTVLFVQNL